MGGVWDLSMKQVLKICMFTLLFTPSNTVRKEIVNKEWKPLVCGKFPEVNNSSQ